MREAARDSIEMFIEAVMAGDMMFFLRMMDGAGSEMSVNAEAAIKRWGSNVNNGESPATVAELQAVYRMFSGTQIPLSKFVVLLRKRGVPKPEDIVIEGKTASAIKVRWTAPASELQGYKHILGGVKAQPLGNAVDRAVLTMGR
jgi:hypothetical protein